MLVEKLGFSIWFKDIVAQLYSEKFTTVLANEGVTEHFSRSQVMWQ